MINLLKGEIYKVFKSKASLLTSIIVFLYAMCDVYMMVYASNHMAVAESIFGRKNISGIDAFIVSMQGQLFYVIIGIYSAIFVAAEYSTGSIRQIASRGLNRNNIIFAKYIAISFFNAILIYMYLLINFIGGVCIGGIGKAPVGFDKHFPIMIIGVIVMSMGYGAISMFISYLVKSSGISVAINILLVLFGGMGCQLIYFLTKQEFIVRYWITSMSSVFCSIEANIGEAVKCLTVFMCIGAVFVVATMVMFSKRDID